MKTLLTIVFLAFATLQMGTSFCSTVTYPLNPYRMFSKNWKDGITISGFSVKSDKFEKIKVWKLIDAPFFQVNQIFWNAFASDKKSFNIQEKLCYQILQENHLTYAEIFLEEDNYKIINNKVSHSNTFRQRVFTCAI